MVDLYPERDDGSDVSDWLVDAGDDRDHMETLAAADVPEWQPTEETEAEEAPDDLDAPNWDDPDFSILEDRRGELPSFPSDIFVPEWQELLERIALGAGVRVEHVAVPLLGVASSRIGTARRVRASNSWSEPMTVWAAGGAIG